MLDIMHYPGAFLPGPCVEPLAPPLRDLHRLKINGLSPNFTDMKLRQLFSLCGQVVEARIVYDRDSGKAAGYAYVSFATKAEADLAIATFDGQVQLQPGGELMSVYYAKRQQGDPAAARDGPGRNAKLYFTDMPAGVPRDGMLKLFSQHGRVRHLQLYADDLGALTSGTVTMFSRSEAVAAMAALDGVQLSADPAIPALKVAWAQLNVLPKAQQAEVAGATVAYEALPPGVTPHEVAALFQRFGPVLKVIPFPARPDGPPGTRGCGRVIMAHPAHIDAAAATLNGKFIWPGAEFPLVVTALHDVPASAAAFAGPGALPRPAGMAGTSAGDAAAATLTLQNLAMQEAAAAGLQDWTPAVTAGVPNWGLSQGTAPMHLVPQLPTNGGYDAIALAGAMQRMQVATGGREIYQNPMACAPPPLLAPQGWPARPMAAPIPVMLAPPSGGQQGATHTSPSPFHNPAAMAIGGPRAATPSAVASGSVSSNGVLFSGPQLSSGFGSVGGQSSIPAPTSQSRAASSVGDGTPNSSWGPNQLQAASAVAAGGGVLSAPDAATTASSLVGSLHSSPRGVGALGLPPAAAGPGGAVTPESALSPAGGVRIGPSGQGGVVWRLF